MLALATGEANVDKKLVESKSLIESGQEVRHQQNLGKLADLAAKMEHMTTIMAEITFVLYGARGRAGMVAENEYNQGVRQDFMDRFQNIEGWIKVLSDREDMPDFHPAPHRRRREDNPEGR